MSRARAKMPLYVDKYRPHSLDKLVVNQDIGANLKKLVRSLQLSGCAFLEPSALLRAPVSRKRWNNWDTCLTRLAGLL